MRRQPAHTREAKLGCVFTPSGCDAQGRPLCDPQSAKLFGAGHEAHQGWLARTRELLDSGQIDALVSNLRQLQPSGAELHKLVLVEAEYFEHNAERTRYAAFREQGLIAGCGVIEAGCKTVIGNRLKRSGMFWTVRGANAILALRCCRLSARFEDYWAERPCTA